MKELILDLVTSYEDRITAVEEWVTASHGADGGGSLGELDNEKERLKASLKEILARNCSLRKKDFNRLIAGILADSDLKRKQIEEERIYIAGEIRAYLNEQKMLAISLKRRLAESVSEKAMEKGHFETIVGSIEIAYQDKGRQLFAMLRNFQLHLGVFEKEQKEINRRLQRLVDRGDSLKIKDLKRFQTAEIFRMRKAETELRREKVISLLANFKQDRKNQRDWH